MLTHKHSDTVNKTESKKEVRGGDGWCCLFLGIFNQSSACRYLKSVVCMIPLFDFCVPGVTGDLTSLRSDRPLQFHDTHGDNIALSHNKTRARRAESFCKGICFSNRPIAINEKVRSQFLCFQCMSYTWKYWLLFFSMKVSNFLCWAALHNLYILIFMVPEVKSGFYLKFWTAHCGSWWYTVMRVILIYRVE